MKIRGTTCHAFLAALVSGLLLGASGCGTATAPTADEPSRAAVEPTSPAPTSPDPTSPTPSSPAPTSPAPTSPVPTTGASAPTTIPPGFPISWDAIDATGDGGEIHGPGPRAPGVAEISPCDRAVWPPAEVVDRLALQTTGPEWAEARELVVVGSAEQAEQLVAEVRAAVEACPTELNELDPTSSPEQEWRLMPGPDGVHGSVTISLTYADGMPGGVVWRLTRVGEAVLALGTGGEITLGLSTRLAARRLDELTDHLAAALCPGSDAGCRTP